MAEERGNRLVEHFIVAVKQPNNGAEMITRYPPGSSDDLDFCRSVTMFMFPSGFGASAWDSGSLLPLPPTHHIFALTDVRGDRLFGASLCFFEAPILSRRTSNPDNNNEEDVPSSDRCAGRRRATTSATKLHAKAICLLSRRPMYLGLLKYLEELLLLGLRQSAINRATGASSSSPLWFAVEKTLCNLFHEVPAPMRSLAIQVSVAETEVVFQRDLPFEMDAELMTIAFMALEPSLIVRLVLHALLEHRILVVVGGNSSSNGSDTIVATAIVETVRALLFPFQWLHVSIPSVPDAVDLPTLLEAPVPFIAGACSSQLAGLEVPTNVVKLEFIGNRFVLNEGHDKSYEDSTSGGVARGEDTIKLHTLPVCATELLARLSAARLPDNRIQKRELNQRMWDRRIHLQKSCLLAPSDSQRESESRRKSYFLVRSGMMHRKMMKQFLELAASLLDGFPACILATVAAQSPNQPSFDQEKFVQLKPAPDQIFYRQLMRTAHFQAFVVQYHDYVAGALSVDDALNMQFVLSRLLRPIRTTGPTSSSALSTFTTTLSNMTNVNIGSQNEQTVTSPTITGSATAKTFVAQPPDIIRAPNITSVASVTRRQSTELQTPGGTNPSETVSMIGAWGRFPDLEPSSFGSPRTVVFPRQSDDTVTLSLGTLVPKPNTRSTQQRGISKDVGLEWMQQLLQSVSNSTKRLNSKDEKFTIRHGDSKQKMGASAPFTRSRTIDRLGIATDVASRQPKSNSRMAEYHRSLTQGDDYAGDLASGVTSAMMLNRFHTMRSPHLRDARHKIGPSRARSIAALAGTAPSVWLATVATCGCCDTVTRLTHELVDAQQAIEPFLNEYTATDIVARGLERVADRSCTLIDILGDCGHPAEAKAVFEDCLMKICHHRAKENTLRCLETIADNSNEGSWKMFSSLVRCYVKNGLVQRAFDLLVQVKIRDERMLDPSLGVLSFSASVESAERQIVLQRIYATFSAGNLGLALGSREPGIDRGCIVLSTGNRAKNEKPVGRDQAPSAIIEPNDLVETVNGEMVLHYPFPIIVARLKRASRPMAVTFLRGMAKANSLHAWYHEQSTSVQPASDLTSAMAALSWSANSANNTPSIPLVDDSAPRSALCDRFGLLPERGICIIAEADCADCGARSSLADIQAGWSLKDENDYTTRCSRCGRRYVPRLSIRIGESCQGEEEDMLRVEYLSTPVIRKELANLAQKLPLTAVTMGELRTCNPRIYWNVVVKLLALECPLDFMDLPHAIHKPYEHLKVEAHDECDSVVSEVSISCGTEPRPLSEDEDQQSECDSSDNGSPTIESDNNNDDNLSDTIGNSSSSMEKLERVFLAVMDSEEFGKCKSDSFEVVADRIMERLRLRLREQE